MCERVDGEKRRAIKATRATIARSRLRASHWTRDDAAIDVARASHDDRSRAARARRAERAANARRRVYFDRAEARNRAPRNSSDARTRIKTNENRVRENRGDHGGQCDVDDGRARGRARAATARGARRTGVSGRFGARRRDGAKTGTRARILRFRTREGDWRGAREPTRGETTSATRARGLTTRARWVDER